MSVGIYIKDGESAGDLAAVTSDHALKVTALPLSARDVTDEQATRRKALRLFFEDSAGNSDIAVDGSTTNVVFEAKAIPGQTRAVRSVRWIFHDADFRPNKGDDFGQSHGGGLTNGLLFVAIQGGIETQLLSSTTIRYVSDLLQSSDDFLSVEVAVNGGLDDLFTADFVFEEDIILVEGSLDTIKVTVRDDLSVLFFACVEARGYYEVHS